MNRNIKMKLYFIVVGIIILVFLYIYNYVHRDITQIEGRFISNEKVLEQLVFLSLEEVEQQLVNDIFPESIAGKNMTYEKLKQLLELLNSKELILSQMQTTYSLEHEILESDWYKILDGLILQYDQNNEITKSSKTILGSQKTATNFNGEPIGSHEVVTDDGFYQITNLDILDNKYQNITIYEKNNLIFAYYLEKPKELNLDNTLILELKDQELHCVINEWVITFPYLESSVTEQEEIGDITLYQGSITALDLKKEKYTGKLLTVKEDTIEIEGVGELPIAENATFFKVFGKMEAYQKKDLAIGYSFTDFIVENGTVVACLVVKEEEMEYIRVLLKNSDYQGYYHENIELSVDTDYTLINEEEEIKYKARDTINITKDSKEFVGDRITIKPSALTSKTQILSLKRSIGNSQYRGIIEIEKTPEGLLVTNELLLEEYLYAVVPSEMPASYPSEALKAQAVTARTYGYRYLKQAGLPEFGTHVDDSTTFQVYQNIGEHLTTSQAVKDTQGEILYYGDSLASTYYYSTSCGLGTNIEVWSENNGNDYPYLCAKEITNTKLSLEEQDVLGEDIENQNLQAYRTEEVFLEHINQVNENDYEHEEGWYRWKTEIHGIDQEELLTKLKNRYQAVPYFILTEDSNGEFISKEIITIGEIEDIKITERNDGGVCETVVITGSEATIQIAKEYNIRYILSNGSGNVLKQNGDSVAMSTLLPSAYFVLETIVDEDQVVGYHIKGGGYGHGVGMSQNGAKAMAIQEHNYREIIEFFYSGTTLEKAY